MKTYLICFLLLCPWLSRAQVSSPRVFSQSDRVTLYYWHVKPNFFHNPLAANPALTYSKDGAGVKVVSYTNLKTDLADNAAAMAFVKKAKRHRFTQWVLVGLGTSLYLSGLVYQVYDAGQNPLPPPASSGIMPHFKPETNTAFLASGVCLVVPIFLNKPKQENLIRAMQLYE